MSGITIKQLESVLDKKLGTLRKDIQKDITHSQEELARLVSGGFNHVYEQLGEISTKLDVRMRVDMLERKIQKIETALHIKL